MDGDEGLLRVNKNMCSCIWYIAKNLSILPFLIGIVILKNRSIGPISHGSIGLKHHMTPLHAQGLAQSRCSVKVYWKVYRCNAIPVALMPSKTTKAHPVF